MPSELIFIFLVSMVFFVSLDDLKFHRISNISILSIALILSFDLRAVSLGNTVLALLICWLVGIFLKVGMGDLKLLSVLILLQGQILLRSEMLILFSLVSALSLLIHFLTVKRFSGDIALAPGILIPFTYLYSGF